MLLHVPSTRRGCRLAAPQLHAPRLSAHRLQILITPEVRTASGSPDIPKCFETVPDDAWIERNKKLELAEIDIN